MDRVAHTDAHFAFTHAELLEHLHQSDLAVVRHEQIEELVQNLLLGVPGSSMPALLGIADGNQNANRFQDFVREHELGVLAEDHLSEERLRLLGSFLVFLQSGLRRFGNFTLRGSRFGFSGGDGGNGFSGQVFNDDLGHGALLSGYRFNRGTTRTTGSWGNKLAHVRLLKR